VHLAGTSRRPDTLQRRRADLHLMECEAVYYAAPAPTSNRSLTLLGLVFDRLIFPGVHVPTTGVDLDATVREYNRLHDLFVRENSVPIRSADDLDRMHMLNLISATLNAEHLKDFFVYTGRADGAKVEEPDMHKLAHELELAMVGLPPPGFTPTVSLNFSKGLPGDARTHINSLSWLTYPANALLYAARTGTVLVNDDPRLPVPAVGGMDLKANAKQLAVMMALESVRLVLPNIPDMPPEELAAFRSEAKDLLQPFRQAMLKLSKELNAAILSDATLADVQREGKFIAETVVLSQLETIKAELSQPRKPWYRRPSVDALVGVPTLLGAFAQFPLPIALAMTAAQSVKILADIRDAQLEKEGIAKRGGFHYLLKIESMGKR
jgi:hypothetical protein